MCKQNDGQSAGRRSFLRAGLATTAGTLAVAAGASEAIPARAQAVAPADADQIIQDWPATAKEAAQAMLEKYGAPDEATKSLLIWYENGPWKRTVVYREEIDHDFPMPHKDVLEQFINYEVPPDKYLGHAFPVLRPARALLTHISLGLRPSLHRLRNRSPGVVRRLPRYYGGV